MEEERKEEYLKWLDEFFGAVQNSFETANSVEIDEPKLKESDFVRLACTMLESVVKEDAPDAMQRITVSLREIILDGEENKCTCPFCIFIEELKKRFPDKCQAYVDEIKSNPIYQVLTGMDKALNKGETDASRN